MHKKPLISVIIPCYNVSRFIPAALNSVLNQTYQNIECIIVDDGSTDDTEKVVNEYVDADKRVKYYRKENGGVSTARNYGIEKASGDLIQFLDADDSLPSEKFDYQVNYIIENNIHDEKFVLYADYEIHWYGENNEIIKKEKYEVGNLDMEGLKEKIIGRKFGLATPTPLHVCSTLISKSVTRDFKFNEHMANYGDLEYFIQLLYSETSFYYTPIIGFYYREWSGGISKDKTASRIGYIQYLESIYDKAKDDLLLCPNMYEIIHLFSGQRNYAMFDRTMRLVKNANIPVYATDQRNIRNLVVFFNNIKLYYPYLLLKQYKNRSIKKIKRLLKKN